MELDVAVVGAGAVSVAAAMMATTTGGSESIDFVGGRIATMRGMFG